MPSMHFRRHSRFIEGMMTLLFVVSWWPLSLQADEPAQSLKNSHRPELVSCVIGDVSFQIDAAKLWTLSGINFKSHSIATADSAYGTVLNIDGVGLLGTAHFLDVPGQPGTVEKEDVTSLHFVVDGTEITPEEPLATLQGQSFRLVRESTIRAVRLKSEVRVQGDVLTETVWLQTSEDVPLKLTYPLMYAWSPSMSDYLFGDDTGITRRGSFLKGAAKPGEGLERTARWMAVYDSAAHVGAVCLLMQKPETEDVRFQYTDAPNVYRKLRLMSFSEKTMPAGFRGVYQCGIGFFESSPSDWEQAAVNCLARLKKIPQGDQ